MTEITAGGIFTAGYVYRCCACEKLWVVIDLECPFCANDTFTKEPINGVAA